MPTPNFSAQSLRQIATWCLFHQGLLAVFSPVKPVRLCNAYGGVFCWGNSNVEALALMMRINPIFTILVRAEAR